MGTWRLVADDWLQRRGWQPSKCVEVAESYVLWASEDDRLAVLFTDSGRWGFDCRTGTQLSEWATSGVLRLPTVGVSASAVARSVLACSATASDAESARREVRPDR